jgi:hypothetical protein
MPQAVDRFPLDGWHSTMRQHYKRQLRKQQGGAFDRIATKLKLSGAQSRTLICKTYHVEGSLASTEHGEQESQGNTIIAVYAMVLV